MFVNRNPEYFLTIAKECNITKAAERLYVSQSYLSQHIARLESELDVKLFDRSSNPIELTDAGRAYYNYLEDSAHSFQKLARELDAINSNRQQTLHLGISTLRGAMLLPEILPAFIQTNPKTRLVLHELPVSELYRLVSTNEIDFAIMNTREDTPSHFTKETLFHENILLVGNREHPNAKELLRKQASGLPLTLDGLESERFILLAPELTVAKMVQEYLNSQNIVLKNQIVTTNCYTALNLVAKNLGFCFLIESGRPHFSSQENLCFFNMNASQLKFPLSIVYKERALLSADAREMIEIMRSYYKTFL